MIGAARDTTDPILAELAAGKYDLKLSRLGKRTEIRATPIRDTVISRWYHGRTVTRTVKANGLPIIGSFKTPDSSGLRVYIHADPDNPAGIPCATWLVTAADFYWEAYCPVEIDAL